jgi:hypothetical protein
MWKTFALAALGLATLAAPAKAETPRAAAWEIGPWIKGKNYSVGMPLHPSPEGDGWSFRFPHSSRTAGHVHYVTYDPGSLAGKSRIVVRYRVNARPGTQFLPQENQEEPATVSLFFQRRGDTWTARRQYEHYRWYAPVAHVQRLKPGVHTMVVKLDDPTWVSVGFKPASANPAAFDAAKRDTWRIGLVFGSPLARGHGVFATAPATFDLLDFRVE